MEKRTRFEASLDKRSNVRDCEAKGIVADSLEVRMALMEQVKSGEKTLAQVQAELKKIKSNAKKNGMITRSQAFSRG
jgi:dynactin complex subunit